MYQFNISDVDLSLYRRFNKVDAQKMIGRCHTWNYDAFQQAAQGLDVSNLRNGSYFLESEKLSQFEVIEI